MNALQNNVINLRAQDLRGRARRRADAGLEQQLADTARQLKHATNRML